MNVLHIISSGGMYGAEAVILNISRTLNESSHRSVLGVFSNSANPNLQLHQNALHEGIESHLIPCAGQIDLTVAASIRRLAAQTNADVVHAHGYKADVYVFFALRTSKVPLVSTCHTWIDDDLLVRVYGIVDRLVLRKYRKVVAVSQEVKQQLLSAGVREGKIHVIRNGIDLRPFNKAIPSLRDAFEPEGYLIVGLIGRLSKEKGIDIFLQAASRILVDFPRAKFVAIGDGPDRDKLNSIIDELNIREHASLLGRRDDMPSVYASLDVMVSASRQEGLPMAILEGMASRLPLVATTVGEVPSVVLDGRTGVIVPPENVDLLASAILNLLQSAARRKQLGVAARKLIEDEFSADRMTSEYLCVYEEAMAARENREAGPRQIPFSPGPTGN